MQNPVGHERTGRPMPGAAWVLESARSSPAGHNLESEPAGPCRCEQGGKRERTSDRNRMADDHWCDHTMKQPSPSYCLTGQGTCLYTEKKTGQPLYRQMTRNTFLLPESWIA